MSTPSNVIPEASVQSQVAAPAEISPAARFYWSVRRELWEGRYIYLAPAGVGALYLVGFIASAIFAPGKLRALFTARLLQQHAIELPYDMVGALMMLVTMIVAVFFCLDSLYGERRDRSILFWKSLPVSDVTTVLAKFSVPIVILPVVGWAVATMVEFMMFVVSSVVLAGSGGSAWSHLELPRMSILLLYHLFTVHSLWWAPFFAWMLMVSAWARRVPMLWAVLPLIAIIFGEMITFNTSHLLQLLISRFSASPHEAVLPRPGDFPTHPMTHLTPLNFVTNPGLWIGFAIAGIFLAIAVRLRKYREPI